MKEIFLQQYFLLLTPYIVAVNQEAVASPFDKTLNFLKQVRGHIFVVIERFDCSLLLFHLTVNSVQSFAH